jgi:MFS family permease
MLYLPVSYAWVGFGVAGFLVGLAPGPIVSLTAQILSPQTQAFGTGIYYSVYYVLMMLAPPVAGAIADYIQDTNVALILAALMIGAAILAFGIFRRSAIPATIES